MKITFVGWGRSVFSHEHKVKPLPDRYARHPIGKAGAPLQWSLPLQANGKIDGVGLSGDFRIRIDFDAMELRNWLTKYVISEPEAAIRLLGEMQAEAQIALANLPRKEETLVGDDS